VVEYFARQLWPYEPDVEIPFVPQEDIDVLIYGATARALLMDTDQQNAANFEAVFQNKLKDLRRKNNRQINDRTALRSSADVFMGNISDRIPLTRAASLGSFLSF
jgi:hypothetical protein